MANGTKFTVQKDLSLPVGVAAVQQAFLQVKTAQRVSNTIGEYIHTGLVLQTYHRENGTA
jgi:hypothetical protein